MKSLLITLGLVLGTFVLTALAETGVLGKFDLSTLPFVLAALLTGAGIWLHLPMGTSRFWQDIRRNCGRMCLVSATIILVFLLGKERIVALVTDTDQLLKAAGFVVWVCPFSFFFALAFIIMLDATKWAPKIIGGLIGLVVLLAAHMPFYIKVRYLHREFTLGDYGSILLTELGFVILPLFLGYLWYMKETYGKWTLVPVDD